jgi:small ligand-binding sensory domain FIST
MGLESFSLVEVGSDSSEILSKISSRTAEWLKEGNPTLALVFISSHLSDDYSSIIEELNKSLRPQQLVGCSTYGTIGVHSEYEDTSAVSLLLLRGEGVETSVHHIHQSQIEESTGPGYWHLETDIPSDAPKGIFLVADPFTVSIERLIRELNEAYPESPIVGGLASGENAARQTHLFHDDEVRAEGALIIFFQGQIRLESVVSQGCKPIGDPLIITKAETNVIYEIANQPSLKVLNEILMGLSPQERKRAQRNIFAGLAVNEYLEEFKRGDFLVRNLIGADQDAGSLTIGARVHVGQTIQFQMRDSEAAHEDMVHLLEQKKLLFGSKKVKAALMCSCNGRGEGLFGKPHHDPLTLSHMLGDFPLAGFFCNGEIGPVGNRAFVHGYTCAMALLLDGESP